MGYGQNSTALYITLVVGQSGKKMAADKYLSVSFILNYNYSEELGQSSGAQVVTIAAPAAAAVAVGFVVVLIVVAALIWRRRKNNNNV